MLELLVLIAALLAESRQVVRDANWDPEPSVSVRIQMMETLAKDFTRKIRTILHHNGQTHT